MRLQNVHVCFITGATIRVKLHCFPFSCFLSAFRPHSLWSQAGSSFALANLSVNKMSSTIMYLCSGIKQIVNVINQTVTPNRRLYTLMQHISHSYLLIKQETQDTILLMWFTKVWSFSGLSPLGSVFMFHPWFTPSYFQDNGIVSNVKLCSENAQWQAHRWNKMIEMNLCGLHVLAIVYEG